MSITPETVMKLSLYAKVPLLPPLIALAFIPAARAWGHTHPWAILVLFGALGVLGLIFMLSTIAAVIAPTTYARSSPDKPGN